MAAGNVLVYILVSVYLLTLPEPALVDTGLSEDNAKPGCPTPFTTITFDSRYIQMKDDIYNQQQHECTSHSE